jgi:disulfide oxidoreductase YuzD
MKNKILSILPNDKHTLLSVSYPEIHIVDWKDIDNSRGIEVFDKKQEGINSVCLFNESELDVIVDSFEENALPMSKGKQASQCECVSFPSSCDETDWMLAIETKYANDEEAAFRIWKDDENYPEKMVSQIISTVEYFRDKKIIENDRVVHAIVSFPNLVADFNSSLFSFVKEEWSIENLLVNKRIRIKGCNAANIISAKRIKFITD